MFAAGETGDRYFVVTGGVAEVLDGDACIARLGTGEGFGEIALLRDQPRANTIRVADARARSRSARSAATGSSRR